MANQTTGLAQILAVATGRSGSSGGVATILGEGVVAEVGEVVITPKGQKKRTVTIALLGGGSREPQVIRAKLTDDHVALADGLAPFDRVKWLGTYTVYFIEGKSWPVIALTDLERVSSQPAKPDATERA